MHRVSPFVHDPKMRTKGINSLFQDALDKRRKEIEAAAAVEALRNFSQLDMSLKEFVRTLRSEGLWKSFQHVSLQDFIAALGGKVPAAAPKKTIERAPAAPRKKRSPYAKVKRLTKKMVADLTDEIIAFLNENPGSSAAAITAAIRLEKINNGTLLMVFVMSSPVLDLRFRILLKRQFGENDKIDGRDYFPRPLFARILGLTFSTPLPLYISPRPF